MRQGENTTDAYETHAVLIVLIVLLLLGGEVGYRAQPITVRASHKPTPISHNQSDALARLGRYMDALSAKLDPRARGALTKINGMGRRLLALRGYLRVADSLDARWTWTAEEIKRFERTAEYRAALNEVEKVRQKFAKLNPGYELYVNTQVRTLENQIKKWNETKSVRTAADQLLATTLKELADAAYKDAPNEAGTNRFRRFLQSAKLGTAPTVATPGLSQHGQLRAFDFQVQRGNQLVAGTDSAAIGPVWEGQGWAKKLNQAILAASRKFKGPLVSPREPWHYEYVP